MPRPDEGLIHTYLDGECTPEEAALVERMMATDPAWLAAVAEARGLKAAASRIVQALDAVPGGVQPASAKGPTAGDSTRGAVGRGTPRRFVVRGWVRAAAALVLVAGTAYVVGKTGGAPEVSVPAPAASPEADRGVTAPEASPDGSRAMTAPAAPTVPTSRGEQPAREAERQAERQALTPLAPVRTDATGQGSRAVRVDEMPSAIASARADSSAAKVAGETRRREVAAVAGATTGARAAAAPAARDLASEVPSQLALRRLEDCYLVSAPDSLRGVLRNPLVVHQSRDTLTLQLDAQRQVTVLLVVDGLRGALTATRIPCPTP